MKTFRLSLVAATLCFAFSHAQAASQSVDSLSVFSNVKAGSPQQVLQQYVGQSAAGLTLVRSNESLLGKHYYYQQMLHGLPIDQADVAVSIGHNGQLLKVHNQARQVSAEDAAKAFKQLHSLSKIGNEAALDRAWANMKVQHALLKAPQADMVWVVGKDGVQLAYKVQIAAEMPTGGFVQYLSAQDGSLLKSYSTSLPRHAKNGERSLEARATLLGGTLDRAAATQAVAKRQAQQLSSGALATPSGINGTGFVFDPDPRTTLNNDSITDTSAASVFEPAYFNKPLRDLTVTNGVYSLSGPFVNIKNIESPATAPSTTTNGAWTAKRGNNAFDDTNVYFHLDQNQRYIQSLGFTGTKSIINRPLDVDTDGLNGDDNSHYSYGGATDYLAFGHGCVNDSEDADVILHEYGHAIHRNINSNWSGGDTGAMGEGFGDYWAGSYSYSTANGKTYHPEWAFSWDGHNSCWGGRMMNRTDAKYNSSKTYGAHSSVTENGVTFVSDELWSTPLFQSLTALVAAGKSRDNVDKIILEAHFGLGSGVTMRQMATSIVNAAKNLFPNDLTYANTFQAKFEAQNILGAVVPPGPSMNETESNNTAATANTVSTTNTTVNGTMSANSDLDFFKVSLNPGLTLSATLTPNSTSDYDLHLFDSNGTTQLASSVKGTGQVDTVSYKNTGTSPKTLYVRVKYYSGGTGATNGKYTLNLKW
ncbi:M4 family metallopeptidase [Massilia sp. W12]|uniref:M4 family metallopeptidase n=1 Tax=Massilia sp. W12 TaxID=3126507 RepID=UPI0030D429B7